MIQDERLPGQVITNDGGNTKWLVRANDIDEWVRINGKGFSGSAPRTASVRADLTALQERLDELAARCGGAVPNSRAVEEPAEGPIKTRSDAEWRELFRLQRAATTAIQEAEDEQAEANDYLSAALAAKDRADTKRRAAIRALQTTVDILISDEDARGI